MNKGIIMEVKKNYAIALNDEGIMDKITSKQNMKVGQKIFYFEDDIVRAATDKPYKSMSFMKRFGSIAALFLLVFTFFQTIIYEDAYAVVSLDINPSIQIEADSKLKIIKVEGVNTDGKNIDFSDVEDMPLDDGIQKIKEKLIEKNYLDSNKEVLVGFAFVDNEGDSTYEETLKDAIQTTFSTEKVTYVKGDKEAVDEAKTKGISLGRYEASLVADEETKSKIDKAPVKDITSSIKDKDNVIQWEAEDEKITDVPAVTTPKTEVEVEKPVADKPVINAPSDQAGSVSNGNDEKDNNIKHEDNAVLELEPEVPVQSGNESKDEATPKPATETQDDNIIIEPNNNGTIQNNTTSGKIEEDPSKVHSEPEVSEHKENSTNESKKN